MLYGELFDGIHNKFIDEINKIRNIFNEKLNNL
jgi:hypothetical protein